MVEFVVNKEILCVYFNINSCDGLKYKNSDDLKKSRFSHYFSAALDSKQ